MQKHSVRSSKLLRPPLPDLAPVGMGLQVASPSIRSTTPWACEGRRHSLVGALLCSSCRMQAG